MKQKLEQAILQQDIPEIEACLTRYEACNPTDFDLFSYKISLALLKEDFQAAYDLAKTAITLNPFDGLCQITWEIRRRLSVVPDDPVCADAISDNSYQR